MRIEQLYYFMEICQTNSLNEAAKKLYISQPALTQSIKALENELNIQLFNRNRKGIFPTEACLIFANHAKAIVQEYEQALADIHKTRHFQNVLNFCVYPVFTNLYTQFITQDLYHTFPQLAIHFREVLPKDVHTALEKFDHIVVLLVDIGHTPILLKHFPLECFAIGEDTVCAFVSQHSPYAKCPFLTAEQLRQANCISLRDFSTLTEIFDPSTITTYSQSLALSQQLILTQSATLHFLKKLGAKLLAHPDIIAVPIKPAYQITYQLVTKKELLAGEFQPVIIWLVNTLRHLLG